jgi:hypothetical protein
MIDIHRNDDQAKEILHSMFKPGKSSWNGDGIQGLVLKTENEVVSAIIYQKLTQSANWVFIHALGTVIEHRNRGYARALLENLMKMDPAPPMIFLEPINGDSRLPMLYKNWGFIPSSTHDEQIKKEVESLGQGGNITFVLDNKA